MSAIRTIVRSTVALGVAVAGIQALGMALAGPAQAYCGGHGCYPSHWAPSYRGPKSGATSHATNASGHRGGHPYQYNPKALNDVDPHGTSHRTTITTTARGPADVSGRGGGVSSETRTLTALPPPGSSQPRQSSGSGTATNGSNAPNANATLQAVRACVVQGGASCPMPQRDLGTACQCTDGQGHVYDGIVK